MVIGRLGNLGRLGRLGRGLGRVLKDWEGLGGGVGYREIREVREVRGVGRGGDLVGISREMGRCPRNFLCF